MGHALYEALEDALRRMGILSAYACVACPNPDDEHLTDASSRFHERMGYAKVGEFADCGNKFGRWYDIAWMKKDLGPHKPDPKPVTPLMAQTDIVLGNRIRGWVPVTGREDVCVHFALPIPKA